jgi:hypothetical protein
MVEELTLENDEFMSKQLMKSTPVHVKELLAFSHDPHAKTTHAHKNVTLNENTWARVKAIMTDTGLESTAHGIPNMISNKVWPFKLMWIVCFLASCGGCGFLLHKSVNDYLAREVVTTIRKIGETPTIFPTVTVCNTNLVVNQKMHHYVFENMLMDKQIFGAALDYYDYIKYFLFPR